MERTENEFANTNEGANANDSAAEALHAAVYHVCGDGRVVQDPRHCRTDNSALPDVTLVG